MSHSHRELIWQILGAVLSGALVVFAFPGFGYEVGLDGLVWIALVPLCLSAFARGGRRGLLLGWCTGLLLEGAGFCWILLAIRRFTQMPPSLASLLFGGWLLYASMPWAFLGAVLGRCRHRGDLVWALLFWVALEGFFPRIFPWHLGGALYGREWLRQCADLLGASGLTALVLLGNFTTYAIVECLRVRARLPWTWAGIFLAVLIAALLYGRIRAEAVTRATQSVQPLRVLLVQGALDPIERGERGLETYLKQTAAALQGQPAPDLVVWPEGADQYPFDFTKGADVFRHHRSAVPGLSPEKLLASPLVAGGGALARDRLPRGSNVAFFLEPGKPPQFYEKNCRIPFGEEVPFYDWWPRTWRENVFQNIGVLYPGTQNPPRRLGSAVFRNLICYEAVLPDYVREAATGSDFLVNITEDIWYGRTAHIPQHASVLILRVIENRTPVVRATNIGPSGVVDATGNFHRGQKIFAPDVVWAELRPCHLGTVYRAWGHYFPWVALLLVVGRWSLRGVQSYRRLKSR